jgi:hypothetical protein
VKVLMVRYLLISLAVVVGFFAVKYALANLHYLKVDAYLTRWQQSKDLTREELNDALMASNSMLNLHGHHPHYLNVAAKVYEWQAFKYQQDLTVYQSSLQQALRLYQQATISREQWPLTWASMANVKSKMGLLDKDFYVYLDKAITYGPYMQEVNLQVAKLFLTHWGRMQQGTTKIGLEQIRRALLNNKARYDLLKYATSIEKQNIVCTVGRLNKIDWVAKQWACK